MPKNIFQARSLWLQIHLWTGLFLLLLSLPIGVTGSINVYHRELDAGLYPEFFQAQNPGPSLGLDQLLENLKKQHDDPMVSIILPDAVWTNVLFHQRKEGKVWRTALEPATGEIVGRRNQNQAWLPWIYRLHQNLLLKPYWGEELVGISGAVLGVSCLSGLWLWWPTRYRGLRNLRQWHGWVGAGSLVVLLAVAFSGWCLVFSGTARWLLRAHEERPKAISPYQAVNNPEAVIRAARAHRPQDDPRVLVFPSEKNNLWRVAMQPAGYHVSAGGMTQLWIDPASLQIVSERSPQTWKGGYGLWARQFPLHNGSLAGDPGRLAVFVSGLLFPFLAYSGAWLYYRKWALKRRARLLRGPQAR